jgi:hypothetical protein
MQRCNLLDQLEREVDGRRKTRAAETHARNGAANTRVKEGVAIKAIDIGPLDPGDILEKSIVVKTASDKN